MKRCEFYNGTDRLFNYSEQTKKLLTTTSNKNAMFNQYKEMQFDKYNFAVKYYINNFSKLIAVEKFVMNEIIHFIDLHPLTVRIQVIFIFLKLSYRV